MRPSDLVLLVGGADSVCSLSPLSDFSTVEERSCGERAGVSGVADVSDVSGKASAVYACPHNHAQSLRQLIEHAICEIDISPNVSSRFVPPRSTTKNAPRTSRYSG